MNNNLEKSLFAYYSTVTQQVITKAKNIKLLICDVDGVMSDGKIYLGNNGEELKSFNVRDGYGIQCMLTSGIEVAIITAARKTKILEDRCKMLGITHLYYGQPNKNISLRKLLDKLSITNKETAYIGDDLIDLSVIYKVGLGVTVADAHPILLNKVDYVTQRSGGNGAVRELCDIILIAQGKFEWATTE